jgi:hypothetical protein
LGETVLAASKLGSPLEELRMEHAETAIHALQNIKTLKPPTKRWNKGVIGYNMPFKSILISV